MKIITEKREIVGTLKTLLGTYHLLDLRPNTFVNSMMLKEAGTISFYGVDDEGFESTILVRGDFVILNEQVPVTMDVKKLITDKEAQELKLSDEQLSLVE